MRQPLPISLAFAIQYGTLLLCTFAMHLLMRYAAAQALYVDGLRQDTGNKGPIAQNPNWSSKFARPVKFTCDTCQS